MENSREEIEKPFHNYAPVKLRNIPRLLAVILLVDPQPILANKLLIAVLTNVLIRTIVAALVPLQIVLAHELLSAGGTVVLDPRALLGVFGVGVRLQDDLLRVELALVPLVLVLCWEVGVAVLAADHRGDVRYPALSLCREDVRGGLFGFGGLDAGVVGGRRAQLFDPSELDDGYGGVVRFYIPMFRYTQLLE